MLKPAQQYLTIRSAGAPALLLSLAVQGVFRGLKDTRTPLYAISKLASLLIIFMLIFLGGKAIGNINLCGLIRKIPCKEFTELGP